MRAVGVMLSATCAIATAACDRNGDMTPTQVLSVADTADQVLQKFHHFVTADGVRQSELQADTAFFFDASQKTLLRKMKVVFFDSAGATRATVTALRGEYLWKDGSMNAEGSVVMTTADGRVLKSEKLHFDELKQEIWTEDPFEFDDRSSHVRGRSFRSTKDFTNIRADQPTGVGKEGLLMPGQDEARDSGKVP